MKSIFNLFFVVLFLSTLNLNAQNKSVKKNVFVDNQGVMRWGKTNEEVKGFGVNYTAPFAHAYRSGKAMDIDIKKAIDNDVYHFSRLGFDLYRIHVWDTQISDTLGNLLQNEHLDTFDYLLKKLKEKNEFNEFLTGKWFCIGINHQLVRGGEYTQNIKVVKNALFKFNKTPVTKGNKNL